MSDTSGNLSAQGITANGIGGGIQYTITGIPYYYVTLKLYFGGVLAGPVQVIVYSGSGTGGTQLASGVVSYTSPAAAFNLSGVATGGMPGDVTITVNTTGAYATPRDLFSIDSIGYAWVTYTLGTSLYTTCGNPADKYEFGYNGQMKMNEIAGIGNHNTALFWEYSPQIGRRWNLDPKGRIGLSDYSVMGDNPILNADPAGDLFLKMFGSTSEQRKSAREFAKTHQGEVKDLLKKSIHVNWNSTIQENAKTDANTSDNAQSDSKASERTADNSGNSERHNTQILNTTVVIGMTQYFHSDGSEYNPNGETRKWTPGIGYAWSNSTSFLGKLSYGIADDPWVAAQSIFTQHFTGGQVRHIGGEVASPDERISGFVGTATDLVPAGKIGIALKIEKAETIVLRNIFAQASRAGMPVSKYIQKVVEANFNQLTKRQAQKVLDRFGKAANIYNTIQGD